MEFSYTEGAPAVDGVSFLLPQGTVTGLVGPSGCGKSILAKLLLRFYEPQADIIRIGGVDIREIPMFRLMGLVSCVFQDSALFTDTVENNIRMGNSHASLEEVEKAAKSAGLHEVIEALPQGYKTVVGKGGSTLSGGEKQRISIARALLKDAPVVLLDEAPAALDPENEVLIQQAVSALTEKRR